MEQLKKDVKKDHDTLTRIESSINSLCKKLDNNREEHKDIVKLITDNNNKIDLKIQHDLDQCHVHREKINVHVNDKLPWKHFKYIFSGTMSIVFACMIWAATITIDNQRAIRIMMHEFEDHSAFASIAWEKFTGEPWGAASRMELQEAKEQYQKTRKEALEAKRKQDN